MDKLMRRASILVMVIGLTACERDQNLGDPHRDAGGDGGVAGAAGTAAPAGSGGAAAAIGAAGRNGSGGAAGGTSGSTEIGGRVGTSGTGGSGGLGGSVASAGGASSGGIGGSPMGRGGASGGGNAGTIGASGGAAGRAGAAGTGGAAGGPATGGAAAAGGRGGNAAAGGGGTKGAGAGMGGTAAGGGAGGQTSTCGNNQVNAGEICLGPPVRLASAAPANVRVGRFDADAHLDVLVYSLMGRTTSGPPAILYGAGDGTFTSPQTVSDLGPNAGGLDVGDLDGNGTDDIVSGSYDGDLLGVVRTGQSPGRGLAYAAHMATNYHQGFAGVAIGRLPAVINQPSDQLPDILALSRSRIVGPPETFQGYLELFPGTGTGAFGPSALTSVGGPNSGPLTWFFRIADMDGSGSSDVVIADAYSKSISVLFDVNTPQYKPVALNYQTGVVGQTTVGQGVVIEDFDGDGALDISAAQPLPIGQPQPAIYWGNKTGRSFSAATALGITPVPFAAAPISTSWVQGADMNNDGIMDLIVGPLAPASPASSDSSRIGIYIGRGQRQFDRLVLVDLPGIIPLDCAVGDLNEDGARDLVLGTPGTSEVHVLLSTR